jgi:hypothetical protein
MFEQFIDFLYRSRISRTSTISLGLYHGSPRASRASAHKGQPQNKKERNRMRNKMARQSRRINRLVNA